jgi:SnoaL-like domain
MTPTIESFIEEYARRYSAQDADGVSALCETPFLAIREGKAIHLFDREAVREHFAAIMTTYRGMGAAKWSPVEIEPHPLGDSSSFTTVRWNARDEAGNITRDTRTTYHLLGSPHGWRFLSYTNHF